MKIVKEEDEEEGNEGKETVKPTFAETVQYTMEESSIKCLQRNGKRLGYMTNIFLCFTELGFCCVYFVFIAEHMCQVKICLF